MCKFTGLFLFTLLIASIQGFSQVVPVGSGSYTKNIPGNGCSRSKLIPFGFAANLWQCCRQTRPNQRLVDGIG